VVAPLRVARGIQNKVLEAMAMAKPVILTPASFEGLNAAPEREVLLAQSAVEFSSAVSAAISGKWSRIGQAARSRIEENYRWPGKLKELDDAFPEL
jgi:glycosyltransferase involved in cell wall biosynthesis